MLLHGGLCELDRLWRAGSHQPAAWNICRVGSWPCGPSEMVPSIPAYVQWECMCESEHGTARGPGSLQVLLNGVRKTPLTRSLTCWWSPQAVATPPQDISDLSLLYSSGLCPSLLFPTLRLAPAPTLTPGHRLDPPDLPGLPHPPLVTPLLDDSNSLLPTCPPGQSAEPSSED